MLSSIFKQNSEKEKGYITSKSMVHSRNNKFASAKIV